MGNFFYKISENDIDVEPHGVKYDVEPHDVENDVNHGVKHDIKHDDVKHNVKHIVKHNKINYNKNSQQMEDEFASSVEFG